jgi:hypothetical protein
MATNSLPINVYPAPTSNLQQQQHQQQHQHQQQGPQVNQISSVQRLAMAMEQTWMQLGLSKSFIFIYDDGAFSSPLGNVSESMNDKDRAQLAYEHVLHHNPFSMNALLSMGHLLRGREVYGKVSSKYYTCSL